MLSSLYLQWCLIRVYYTASRFCTVLEDSDDEVIAKWITRDRWAT